MRVFSRKKATKKPTPANSTPVEIPLSPQAANQKIPADTAETSERHYRYASPIDETPVPDSRPNEEDPLPPARAQTPLS